MPSTPPPTPNTDLVRDRLRARARRTAVIRRRVVATALATFALAFGTIAATGSLGSTAATGTTGSTQTGSGQSDTTTTTNATTTGSTSSGSTSTGSSGSAVTTSQS
ncbi:MAG TPA: hypothetical protein VF080_11885 [Solirubrobacteraceae bacterium]